MNQLERMPQRAAAPLPEFVYLAEMSEEDYALGFRYRDIASPTPARRGGGLLHRRQQPDRAGSRSGV